MLLEVGHPIPLIFNDPDVGIISHVSAARVLFSNVKRKKNVLNEVNPGSNRDVAKNSLRDCVRGFNVFRGRIRNFFNIIED